MDVIAELIPSLVVGGFFVALLVTALRATDRPKRPKPSTPPHSARKLNSSPPASSSDDES
jgi:hypothetical protein